MYKMEIFEFNSLSLGNFYHLLLTLIYFSISLLGLFRLLTGLYRPKPKTLHAYLQSLEYKRYVEKDKWIMVVIPG